MKNLIKINSLSWMFMSAVTLLSVSAYAQSTTTQTTTTTTTSKTTATDNKAEASTDANMLVEAYSSGMSEIKLAENVKARTVSDEVKTMAGTMITAHTELNNQIRALASTRKVTLPSELSKMQQAEIDILSKKSGMDLDDKYVDMLVSSHKKSVALYEKGSKAEDADIRTFFAENLPKVKEHLDMATDLKERMKVKESEERKSNMN
jgi:putative membrane protein